MRLIGLPAGFYRVNRRAPQDVPADALRRAQLVAWIDQRRRAGMRRDDACRIAGVSARSYTRWRATLRRHGIRALTAKSSRPHRPRLPSKRRLAAQDIERLRRQHPVGKEKLVILLAQQGLPVSASTVGRILRELIGRGVIEPIGASRRHSRQRRNHAKRLHARRKRPNERPTGPGSLVQLDTLHEYSNLTRRIHFSAIDPGNRYAHAKLMSSASSSNAKTFLQECLATWPHPITSLQVDNGSEFKGHFEQACKDLNLELVTIPPASPKSNAKVERLQRTFRDEHYAFEPPNLTLEDANKHLNTYLHFYNHHRPHHALAMKTPMTYHQDRNPNTSHT